MQNAEEIRDFLFQKIIEQMSKLLAFYVVENSEDEDAKTSLKASQLMETLFAGGTLKDEDAPFVEKYKELFDKINSYAKDIKSLDE